MVPWHTLVPPRFQLWSAAPTFPYYDHTEKKTDVGHLVRMDESPDARRILTAVPQSEWRRPVGRHYTSWMATLKSVRSYRRHAISATVESATNQLGDKSRSTRRQLISCLSLYIFRLVRNRHIQFGTSVVQRYHKFGDPMHSSAVPPHTCPTVRLNPPNPVSVSLDQTKCQICR